MVKREGDGAPLREKDCTTILAMTRDKEGCAMGFSLWWWWSASRRRNLGARAMAGG